MRDHRAVAGQIFAQQQRHIERAIHAHKQGQRGLNRAQQREFPGQIRRA